MTSPLTKDRNRTRRAMTEKNVLFALTISLPLLAAGVMTASADPGGSCIFCVNLSELGGPTNYCVERTCPPTSACRGVIRFRGAAIGIGIECDWIV